VSEVAGYAIGAAKALGVEFEPFAKSELDLFDVSFRRQFLLTFPEREIADIFVRHKAEILVAAMVAKKQFGKSFGGERPEANQFGMVLSRAAYFGVGDDWEDAAPFTTGSPQNWIHSGTTLLGGTAGNPIKIGENAVHCILAIGSYHPSPKIESVKLEIDGKPKPIVYTGWNVKLSDLALKELDKSIILYEDRTFLAKVFISEKFGSSVDDYPYLLAVSFLPEDALRLHDAEDVVKAANKIVLTT